MIWAITRIQPQYEVVRCESSCLSESKKFFLNAMSINKTNVTESRTRSSSASGAREKLLVVEDDPAIERMIGDYFRHNGYDVISANDGESGVRLALGEK